MNPLTRYAVGALLLLGLLLAARAWLHSYGDARYAAGRTDGANAVLADDARAVAQARTAQDAIANLAAAAGSDLQRHLGTALPTIEGQTHDAVETVRTIYRDRLVPGAACQRPDGVQKQLDAAVARANAAATGR